MEPLEFLISSGVGATAGFAFAGGLYLFKRTLKYARKPHKTLEDCPSLHRIAAAEKTIYGKILTQEALDHSLVCTRFQLAPDPNSGWRVVGVPVGQLPRIEFLCEHVWITDDNENAKGICMKCGASEATAYRLSSMIERQKRRSA